MKKANVEDVVNDEKNTTELKYAKQDLILSEKYIRNRDILKVLLKDDSSYTFEEVDEILEKFMKGKVN